jgi:hypothetical protein
MRFFNYFLLNIGVLLITTSNLAIAQAEYVQEIDCKAWGTEQVVSPSVNTIQHYIFKPRVVERSDDNNLTSLTPENQQPGYIQNTVALRWNVKDKRISYTVTFRNIFDEEIYKTTLTGCALLIYPDSLLKQEETKALTVAIARTEGAEPRTETLYHLKPLADEERTNWLNQLSTCEELECKLNTLAAKGYLLDVLTLLELEKLKTDPDPTLLSKYWELVTILKKSYGY